MYFQQPPPGGWPIKRRINYKIVAFVLAVWVLVGGGGVVSFLENREREERAEAEARAARVYAESPLGREASARAIRAYNRAAQEAMIRATANAAAEQQQRYIPPSDPVPDERGRDCYVSGHYRRGRWVNGYYRRCR